MNLWKPFLLINKYLIKFLKKFKFNVKTYLSIKFVVSNNQKEKIFSNNSIKKFLDNQSTPFLNDEFKFAEIVSSLGYYLRSFSNINKFLDYICLIFKHTFNEKIILIIPLNYEGEIWEENIRISVNNDFLEIFQKFGFLLF